MTKIHIYSIMWNEEKMLPYFLRHYETFADKIFIFNDHSSDKTAAIAKKNKKVTLLPFNYNRGLHQDDVNDCFQKNYKKYSRGVADWAMCVDGDEFIYNKNIIANLEKQKAMGVRIIRTTCFMMVSKKFPKTKGQIYDEIKTGVRYRRFDKPVVFDPDLDIEFTHGRHDVRPLPSGVRPVKAKLALLHYRYLGKKFYLSRSLGTFARSPSLIEFKDYRITKGLKFYKEALSANLSNVV